MGKKVFGIGVLMILLLAGCGLFKKKTAKSDSVTMAPVLFFANQPSQLLGSARMLNFEVTANGVVGEFSLFPLSNNRLEADYISQGEQGHIRVSDSMHQHSRKLEYAYNRDVLLLDSVHDSYNAIWLSKVNYLEIQKTGRTAIFHNIELGMDTFEFVNATTISIPTDDSSIQFQVVNIKSKKTETKLQFLADLEYPVITEWNTGWDDVTLTQVQLKPTNYDGFVPGPNCVLKYKMVQFNAAEYNFTATNVFWSETKICFHIDGNFNGSPSYDFEYDVCFSKQALTDPYYEVQTFSANAGTLDEDSLNFLFLRKKEIDSMEKNGWGYLHVPHNALDLAEVDTSNLSPEAIENIKVESAESFHTSFQLQNCGKDKFTSYYMIDEDTNADIILPSLSLRNNYLPFEIQVLNRGKFPLLLYYNDKREWEISLEYAGFSK